MRGGEFDAGEPAGRWTYKQVISDVTRAPNVAIERVIFKGYYMAFGRRRDIPNNIMEALGKEMKERNSEGICIYEGQSDRKKMRRMNPCLC